MAMGARKESVDKQGPGGETSISYRRVSPSSGGGVEGKRQVSVDKQGPGTWREVSMIYGCMPPSSGCGCGREARGEVRETGARDWHSSDREVWISCD